MENRGRGLLRHLAVGTNEGLGFILQGTNCFTLALFLQRAHLATVE